MGWVSHSPEGSLSTAGAWGGGRWGVPAVQAVVGKGLDDTVKRRIFHMLFRGDPYGWWPQNIT